MGSIGKEIAEQETRVRQVKPADLAPCPICGKPPRLISTLTGAIYAACIGHLETEAHLTEMEVTALWNAGRYEQ